MEKSNIYLKYRGYFVIFGGVLVHVVLGTLYTFGNMSQYMMSYLRIKIDPTLTYEDSIWIFSTCTMMEGLSFCVGGYLLRMIGPRKTAIIGSVICVTGVLLTYFTIKYSFHLTVLTYGALFGLGIGLSFIAPLSCAMKWLPDKKGLVNGLIVGGIGGGAFIFDPIQTAFLNPQNKVPDKQGYGEDKYFSQSDILDRVPNCLLMLGCCYAGIQMIGSLLLVDPPIKMGKNNEQTYIIEPKPTWNHLKHTTTSYNTLTEKVTTPILPETQNGNMKNEKSTDSEKDREQQGNEYISERNKTIKTDYTPQEVLRSKFGYILWFIFLLNGQGINFISTLYKAYGQTFIKDDYFLAVVGSLTAVCNGGGRIIWGIFSDRYSVRTSLILSSGLVCILMLTFSVTSLVGRELYVVYVCLLFLSLSSNFVLIPTAAAETFGTEHYGMNIGIIFTGTVISSPISALLTSNLTSRIGWDGMFLMISAFSFICMILSWLFKVDKKPR